VVAAAINWEGNRRLISEEGKDAASYYRTLSISKAYSLLEFNARQNANIRSECMPLSSSKLLSSATRTMEVRLIRSCFSTLPVLRCVEKFTKLQFRLTLWRIARNLG
jgi:hypothetical protein